ncbi:BlaI/MecI/CopY family transcriptional regulator [Paenibacillus sp. MMS20-IR301]|uniref:BlaI/MecI/CopY family transcriptional regulator n=1 Tax=Paenibacillus sp. MMS20-IR301 TaxID=2895946 RepID=UPI0028E4676D|nr:BlaI/MecI/CopY family transcriptional regulator [Paenibacillus sp. MMS20-IR301]WNS46224.1 BlaI/MecI/CopY family transcriptional regulator [Paenibacillus sp. MMS20-IR301]
MEIKLFDSELKVMDVLWKEGVLTAKQLAGILKEQVGWNKNTTYTVIKKCIEKGAIERMEPNFQCRATLVKEQVQQQEAEELVNKIFDGSVDLLFASLLNKKSLSPEEIKRLKQLVNELE